MILAKFRNWLRFKICGCYKHALSVTIPEEVSVLHSQVEAQFSTNREAV